MNITTEVYTSLRGQEHKIDINGRDITLYPHQPNRFAKRLSDPTEEEIEIIAECITGLIEERRSGAA